MGLETTWMFSGISFTYEMINVLTAETSVPNKYLKGSVHKNFCRMRRCEQDIRSKIEDVILWAAAFVCVCFSM